MQSLIESLEAEAVDFMGLEHFQLVEGFSKPMPVDGWQTLSPSV
jgi:hypothetical protein